MLPHKLSTYNMLVIKSKLNCLQFAQQKIVWCFCWRSQRGSTQSALSTLQSSCIVIPGDSLQLDFSDSCSVVLTTFCATHDTDIYGYADYAVCSVVTAKWWPWWQYKHVEQFRLLIYDVERTWLTCAPCLLLFFLLQFDVVVAVFSDTSS